VEEALRLVGLPPEEFADKSPFELSGGEKRRAALAGILAMRPKYLVLDEPMAGLDPLGRREIMRTLAMLRQRTGCAVVMVSHSMDDMARNAERIGVLSDGELIRVGTPREIFAEAEFLTSMGLDVPQISLLAMKLRERGVDVPQDVYDMDGMLDFLKDRGDMHV
jgi:energy-coupling factor transport system ATP-binding protein